MFSPDLIAQFLSPKVQFFRTRLFRRITYDPRSQSNIRTDEYSADTLLFLRRILTSMRAPGVLPDDFVLGIKLNAADYVEGSTSSTPEGNRVVQHFREMVSWGLLDFIEISGGDYEDPGNEHPPICRTFSVDSSFRCRLYDESNQIPTSSLICGLFPKSYEGARSNLFA